MFLGESLCSIRCHASACGLARARCPGTVKGSGNIPLWPFVCMKLSFSVWYEVLVSNFNFFKHKNFVL